MTCPTPFSAIWQLNNCPQCGGNISEHALSEIASLRKFHAQLVAAHEEHLRTGEYAPLGIAAQDALIALEKK